MLGRRRLELPPEPGGPFTWTIAAVILSVAFLLLYLVAP